MEKRIEVLHIGYDDGLIVTEQEPIMTPQGNLKFIVGDRIYDVHPFRSDLGGYPVRWSQLLEFTDLVANILNGEM